MSEPTAPRAGTPRRHADVATLTVLRRVTAFLDQSKKLIFAGVALVAAFAGVASWMGAQSGTGPGIRLTRLEVRLDSGFRAIDSTVRQLQADQGANAEKFELLLRINCRGLEFADLLRQCRDAGVPK